MYFYYLSSLSLTSHIPHTVASLAWSVETIATNLLREGGRRVSSEAVAGTMAGGAGVDLN